MTARDPEGGAERERFAALLDRAAAQSVRITLWWRDDDAEAVTPQLARLLALAERDDVPLALAVVPKGATPELAEAIADRPGVHVLQHGWQHENHAPPNEKKMELGEHRPFPLILEELGEGFERLGLLFPRRFLPVLVPPWNRIAPSVRDALHKVGLLGLSTFGPTPPGEAHRVNTHVDIIDWKNGRAALPRAAAFAILCGEVERRLRDDPEPLGILTHHLVHDDASWSFLEELFTLTARHAAVRWPAIPPLFDLSPPG
jgi:peptidoglycan/xylan/chitin deacetylase (PgdA/CDA1 family)